MSVVTQGNRLKFDQCYLDVEKQTPLRSILIATGARELAEAAGKRDRVWGIGFTVAEAPRANPRRWGENLLGKALMQVRRELSLQDG